jgi:apolipoprotein N-acyltransferase
MTREAAGQGAQIVFWPETARPWPIQHFIERPPSFEMPELQSLVREIRVAVVAGVEYYRIRMTHGPPESQLYNAAVVVQPDASLDPTWSAKTYLVPFVEGLPLRPVLGRFLEGREWLGGGFTPGPAAAVLRPRGERVGVLICYEELYPDLTRRLRNAGAQLMAVLTNDAWFGRTVFQRYQADTLRLRAIENRCAFVRVANTGISGFVDPLGRYHGRTGLFEPAIEVDDVAVMPTRTIYDRFGDYPVGMAFGSFVVTAVVTIRRRRRGGAGDDVATRRVDVGSVPGTGPVED